MLPRERLALVPYKQFRCYAFIPIPPTPSLNDEITKLVSETVDCHLFFMSPVGGGMVSVFVVGGRW
jgi:hypothetical protein